MLAFVPGGYQALGILEDLGIGRAPGRGFLLRGLAALIVHLAAVEAHAAGSSECAKEVNPRISTSPLPAEIIELNEVRHDLLTVFGIWIHVLSGLEQREVFGAKFFCNSFIFWDSSSAFSRSFCWSAWSSSSLRSRIWQ